MRTWSTFNGILIPACPRGPRTAIHPPASCRKFGENVLWIEQGIQVVLGKLVCEQGIETSQSACQCKIKLTLKAWWVSRVNARREVERHVNAGDDATVLTYSERDVFFGHIADSWNKQAEDGSVFQAAASNGSCVRYNELLPFLVFFWTQSRHYEAVLARRGSV